MARQRTDRLRALPANESPGSDGAGGELAQYIIILAGNVAVGARRVSSSCFAVEGCRQDLAAAVNRVAFDQRSSRHL